MLRLELTKKEIKKGLLLPNKITTNLAYLCGVLAGDGNINIRKNKNEYCIKCVGNPKNEKGFYQWVIRPLFKEVFNLDIKLQTFDSNTTYGFVIYSKSLVNYFTLVMDLPVGRKHNKLRIPRILLKNEILFLSFIKGLFDTDGCICFKKKYRSSPYYPVISLSSHSKEFVKQVAEILKKKGFKIYESYDYKVRDTRVSKQYTIINRLEMNGKDNFKLWMKTINFSSPKHLDKIKKVAGEGFEFGSKIR